MRSLQTRLAAKTHLLNTEVASSNKQEGISKITRKNSNTNYVQKRLAIFFNINKQKYKIVQQDTASVMQDLEL
jgi:hypothetical protein